MDNNSQFSDLRSFFEKYRHFIQVGIVGVLLIVLIVAVVNPKDDPMSGVSKEYEEQTDNEDMSKLIENYYSYYADGDIDKLEKIAKPISDKEKSYIGFMSEYVEKYTIDEIYSKAGTEEGSYLVSVVNKAKYKDLESEAPGLDFFYVQTSKKGKLYINNLYSTFNTQNGELEVDGTITELIAAFEQQDDVNELRQEVQAEFNKLSLEDAAFNEYFTATLPNAITEWAGNYKKQVEEAEAQAEAEEQAAAEAKAAEEAAAQAEAEAAKAAEEEAAKAAEEEANKSEVYVTEKVNVRAEPNEAAQSIATVTTGDMLTKYSEENGWTKIDYMGTQAYIKSEFLTTEKPDTSAADAAGLTVGSTVRLSESTNIRTEASETSDRLALAYAGESVVVVSVDANGWTKVNYNGQEGYIKTEYVR